jgi:glycosyltransferase involved in cell wall biosynthesis
VNQQKVVCVLGMHRSGTSVASRILNLLGAYLGPEDQLVPPAADNPKGYWEYQPIVELNDAILHRLGGRSMAPPEFPAGWERAPELDDLRERARTILHESFGEADLWAWKDPRACLTLPFWQMLLPRMHYVICVRSPADVALSLARRNRMSHERSVYLWLLYTQQALSHTAGDLRRLAVYDRLIDQPDQELAALGRFLEGPAGSEQPEVRDEVAAFLDTELRHHRRGVSVESLKTPHAAEASAALKLAESAYLALTEREEFDLAEVEGLLRAGLQAVRPGIIRRPTKSRSGALVSVVVDNYNYGRFLRDTIDSALAQTYAPLEVVVVDDGSTDDSRTVIETYGDRITAVLKENGGQASAFNAGFASSRGDVVIFVDSDDVLLPTAVERAMELFEPGVVKVHWPLWEIDSAGNRNASVQPDRALDEGNLLARTIEEGPLSGNSAPTSGNAWSRELLQRVFPIPEEEFRVNADGYLITLAWVYGEVRAIPEPLGLYRVHGNNSFASLSAEQKRERHLEQFAHNCDALEAHLRAIGITRNPALWKLWKGIYDPVVEGVAREMLAAAMPADASFILVDQNAWADGTGSWLPADRRAIPFLERNGEYWGGPADDDEAIRELERLRDAGADFIVFIWFTFWWLDHYAAFASHLWTSYDCPAWSAFFGVFDLRWPQRFASLRDDIATVVPAGVKYVLMDELASRTSFLRNPDLVNERHATSFFEISGGNGTAPGDDASAIAQLKRLRADGAQFIVFPWFASGWLESYPGFAAHLRKTCPCVIENERLLVFRLTV